MDLGERLRVQAVLLTPARQPHALVGVAHVRLLAQQLECLVPAGAQAQRLVGGQGDLAGRLADAVLVADALDVALQGALALQQ